MEYTAIDYHKETPKGKNLHSVLMGHIGEALSNHQFLNFTNGTFVSQQSGVVRTNCLDCLDRTNAVQTVIGIFIPSDWCFMINFSVGMSWEDFDGNEHRWQSSIALQRDHQIALDRKRQRDFTYVRRYRRIRVWLKATRRHEIYLKNYQEQHWLWRYSSLISILNINTCSSENKQRLIERLLYGDLPMTLRGQKILSLLGNEAVSLSKDISENIYFRRDEFATELPIRVSCCTWNVNGGTRSPNLNTDLGEDKFADWLLGKADRRRAAYDFTGEAESDLSFVAGDIITVTGTRSNWIWNRYNLSQLMISFWAW